MGEALDALSDKLERSLTLAEVGYRRVKGRLRRIPPLTDAVEIADRTVDNLAEIAAELRRQRTVAERGLAETNQRIAELRKGGITKGERDDFLTLMAARVRFNTALDDIDTKFAQNRADMYEAQTTRFNEQTTAALEASQKTLDRSDLASKIAGIFGNDGAVARQGEVQLGALQSQQDILKARLREASIKAKSDPRWKKVADELSDQLHTVQENIASQIVENNKAAVDAVNNDISRRQNTLDIQSRIATAFGRAGEMPGIVDQQIGLLREQQQRLSDLLPTIDPRNVGLITEVQDQIAKLNGDIAEKVVESFNLAVEAVDTAAENREFQFGLRDRVAGLAQRTGGVQGGLNAILQRQGIAGDRVSALRDQREGLAGLLGRAMNEGNQGAVKDLTKRLADLDLTIQENVQTQRELTAEYRQAATAAITGQASRTTGLIGTASQIIQRLGTITGATDNSQLLAFAEQTRQTLIGAGQQLVNNISQAITGEDFSAQGDSLLTQLRDAFSAGPESFATKLAALGPTIAALESTMSEANRNSFQALIQSMIDNTTATLDNTEQINQLDGSMNQQQSWSSASWQWFRNAIFDGMGNVLPQYQIPQLHEGGYVTKSGVFDLKVGERVMTPGKPAQGAKVDITVNEAGGPVDTEWLASRIGFELKNK
jgi:hypothetical protein